jgi:hypothetical protein
MNARTRLPILGINLFRITHGCIKTVDYAIRKNLLRILPKTVTEDSDIMHLRQRSQKTFCATSIAVILLENV